MSHPIGRWLTLSMVSLLVLSLMAITSQGSGGSFGGGDGTPSNPFQIEDVSDLQNINGDLDAWYILVNDIDASTTSIWNSGEGFLSIGSSSGDGFTGFLDGNGFSINGLFIERPSVYDIALFAKLGMGGKVSNLSLTEVDITGRGVVAGLAAYHYGEIRNVLVTGIVRGQSNIGGVAALCNEGSIISNADADVDVYGNGSVGGMVGLAYTGSIVEKSVSRGDIHNDGPASGGLVSDNSGYINNSRSSSNIAGGHSSGGLVGTNNGAINNSSSSGTVTGNFSVGGLVGQTHYQSTIRNSFSTGSVNGVETVGGLIGANLGFVYDSYSWSNTVGGPKVGGLIGENERDETEDCGIVHRAYSTGTVSGTTDMGGLIGSNLNGFINHSFWDIMSSGKVDSAGGTGKSTTDMQIAGTFTLEGWDFNTTWFIQEGEYPTLRSQRLLAVPGEVLSAPQGSLFTFDGTASMGQVSNWTWSFMYDAVMITLYNSTVSFTFDIYGTYDVELTVRDEFDANNSSSFRVTITETTPPVAVAGENQTVDAGTTVSFNATLSTDNVGIVTYAWTFTYDGGTVALNGPLPTFAFLKPGEYVVTLTVSDLAGNQDTDDMTVTVLGQENSDTLLVIVAIVAVIGLFIAAYLILRR